MDEKLRALEQKVLGGDASLLPALRQAYLRAGPVEEQKKLAVTPGFLPLSIAHQVRQRPFYDRVAFPLAKANAEVVVPVFNVGVGGVDPSDGRTKTPGDTNAAASGLAFPYGSCFYWSGLSIIPDSGSNASDINEIWNACVLRYEQNLGVPANQWPCRTLMARPASIPQDAAGSLRLVGMTQPVRDIRSPGRRRVMRDGVVREIAGQWPIEIPSQTNARLMIQGRLRRPVRRTTHLMVVLYGTYVGSGS